MDVSSGRRSRRAAIAMGMVLVAGCGESASDSSDGTLSTTTPVAPTLAVVSTLPLAEHFLEEPEVTAVATDLAPSQATGSTVPAPDVPDRCGALDAAMWTAQVTSDGATALVRLRNLSDTWCDFDVGRTPNIDPAIEPDVWLQPGETADLVVGPSTTGCADAEVVDQVQVGVLDASVLVPTALVTCGWWLTAFYPNDAVDVACESADLDVTATAATVVVRNASSSPCAFGGLVSVDGAEVEEDDAVAPEVRELFPGDLVSLGRPDGTDCDGRRDRVVLHDEVVGELEVFDVPCSIVFELGLPQPWFGADVGPPNVPDAAGEASVVLDALDPFGAGQ